LDRLTTATGTGLNETWTYDANGNRQTQGGATSSTYTVAPASNRLSSISGGLTRTYAYAPSGQTTGYGGLTFTYMNSGRLSSVSNGSNTTTYVLNALGQRVKKSGTSVTLFIYDESGHLLGEYDGSGNLIEETVWMGDVPVATLRPNGTGVSVYYIHTDHLNTPRRVSRPADNAIVWRWDTEPFGTATANQDPDGDGTQFVYNPRFPGQYYDVETGLNYNYQRDYDPATGRYVESDPIGLHGGINTYAYVEGSPINLSDPNGQLPLPIITGLIGAGAGAIGNLIGQLTDQCHPFSLTSFLVATGGGFVAGAVLPYVPGGLVGASVWGGISNFGQYWAGSAVQGQTLSVEGTAYAVAGGVVGGALGGAAGRASPWGYGGTAATRAEVDASNAAANARANLNGSSLLGNFWGGVASNLPQGGGTPSCGCGK
jgi:RHS repeat-associated protein